MSLLPLLHSLCDVSWGCSPILGAHLSSNTICPLGNCHTAG